MPDYPQQSQDLEKQGYSTDPNYSQPTSSNTSQDRGIFSNLLAGGVASHFMRPQPSPAPSPALPVETDAPPPQYTPPSGSPPPAGNRIPCTSSQPFPQLEYLGSAPFRDIGGQPVYVASAILGDSVQPCKAAPHLPVACHFPFGGAEQEHQGRYDILPVTEAMEWVPTRKGLIPKGRKPVEGGYERDGKHLFHAAADVRGIKVPGKTGSHLGACNIAFGGRELIVQEYDLLCWR